MGAALARNTLLGAAFAMVFALGPASVETAQGTERMSSSLQTEKTDARVWRKPRPGRPLVIAHRGYSEKHTDNSRESFEAAITAGADLIETDIRQSQDGILVCVHDSDVEGDYVEDLTWAQLAKKGVLRLKDVLCHRQGTDRHPAGHQVARC